MLKRTTMFLRHSEHSILPTLFVVLPLPCVQNSRYLTKEHFLAIMQSLGYTLYQSKETRRMGYWLFQWNARIEEKQWKKEVIREGGGRNNFAICN